MVLSEKDYGDIHIVTDCRNIIDDFERGKRWCLSRESKYAELWEEVWFHIDDFRP